VLHLSLGLGFLLVLFQFGFETILLSSWTATFSEDISEVFLLLNCMLQDQVQDTGVGVNPHDIPKLFCKFLQSNSTTTRNNCGTGLGLAICKRYDHNLFNKERASLSANCDLMIKLSDGGFAVILKIGGSLWMVQVCEFDGWPYMGRE
jgi:hypothetical protein